MAVRKSLIAYYSRKGQNYVSGSVTDLAVGNTEVIAGMIKEITGGDLFEIDTVKAYPLDYTETTEVAKRELKDQARPALKANPESVGDYNVIYLGYPNWWGTMPMAVFTFLESHNLSGKIIAPFCTHEGSGLGRSVADLKKAAPQSTVPDGLAVFGSGVKNAADEVSRWLGNI